MLNKRPWKAFVAYGLISALAALMLVYQVGGILPVLLLMGVVLGGPIWLPSGRLARMTRAPPTPRCELQAQGAAASTRRVASASTACCGLASGVDWVK